MCNYILIIYKLNEIVLGCTEATTLTGKAFTTNKNLKSPEEIKGCPMKEDIPEGGDKEMRTKYPPHTNGE